MLPKEEETAKGYVLKQWAKGTLARGFRTWKNGIARLARQFSLLNRAGRTIKNQALSWGYRTWHDKAMKQRHLLNVCNRVVRRFLQADLSKSYTTWQAYSTQRRESKARLISAGKKLSDKRWPPDEKPNPNPAIP